MSDDGRKERTILFSAPMVRAILAGKKTQTRRLVRDAGDHIKYWRRGEQDPRRWVACDGFTIGHVYCPHGEPGDRLWVRETWAAPPGSDSKREVIYRADLSDAQEREERLRWTPSIHMPRWASRILLELTDVRVERLQGISENDAKAEGAQEWEFNPEQPLTSGERAGDSPFRSGFAYLWDCINDHRATWKSNPWVWALTFEVSHV